MSKVLKHLPEIEGDEQVEVARLLNKMNDEQAEHFARIYRSRRRDPIHILILAAVGLVGVAGLQRLYLEQVGLGIVYLLTGGICLIGTIYDLVKFRDLTQQYNRDVGLSVAETVHQVYDDTDATDPAEP